MSSHRPVNRPSFFTPKQLPLPVAYLAPQAPYPVPAPAPGIPSHLAVRISVMHDPDATVATAELNASGQPLLTTTGSSKRTPGDTDDPEVAAQYAIARALRKMAAKTEKDASGKVRHSDSVREHRAKGKSRKGKPEGTLLGVTVNKISVHRRGDVTEVHLPSPHTEATVPQFVIDKITELYGETTIEFVTDPELVTDPPGHYEGRHARPIPAEGFPGLKDLPLYDTEGMKLTGREAQQVEDALGDDDGHRRP